MKVFVTGASGYVGRKVVDALVGHQHEVVVLSRHTSKRPFSQHSNRVQEVYGDVTKVETLRGLMNGCDAIVHLVGIIREDPGKGVTMDAIHVQGTKHVVQEAIQANVPRFLHMSALGAKPDSLTDYHRTKWQAEQIVQNSDLAYTIFRPSVIFGKGGPGPNFVKQLADLVKKSPVVPLLGDGGFQLQPVSIESVVEGFCRALHNPQTVGHIYEVAGPDILTYLNILKRIADSFGKRLTTIKIPIAVMKALIPILQKVPSFPITRDQFLMLLEGNVCKEDWQSFYSDLQIEPHPFKVEY